MSSRLKVAVVHYHFKPGGVTRVTQAILAGFEATRSVVDFGFISGSPSFESEATRSREIPDLGYTRPGQEINPEALYFQLLEAARETLGGLPDIWHIHNHSLGKNKAFAGVVRRLAADGRPLLLHIHDFAEDGRPSNYAHILEGLESPEDLYPLGEHVHYGLLNGRDYEIMRTAGVPESNIHLLPNPIPEAPVSDTDACVDLRILTDRERLFLYPVRAVRRKNLGELAFWSALAPKDTWMANTLGPSNPDYRADFDRWITRCRSWKLPIVFELGIQTNASFEQIVSSAEAMVSTSVAEGFGLGFLEPWTFGKPLIGRDLAEITQDFKRDGVRLEHLYQRLEIPVDFIDDYPGLESDLRTQFSKLRNQYGQNVAPGDFEEIRRTWIQSGEIDFGVLSEPHQEKVIEKVITERPVWAKDLADKFFDLSQSRRAIPENQRHIRRAFTVEAYSTRLEGIYQTLANARVERVLESIEPIRVLKNFLSPCRFNLLRAS